MAGASCSVMLAHTRSLSTSSVVLGKKNFRKFLMYGKRGTRQFREAVKNKELIPELESAFDRGVRPVGMKFGKTFQIIPEMIPEIIIPDLEGFELKPYVSYKAPDVIQSEFGPQDLFYAVYSEKITEDFKNGKLNEDGSPVEPSDMELLTAEEAKKKALTIGSDIFA